MMKKNVPSNLLVPGVFPCKSEDQLGKQMLSLKSFWEGKVNLSGDLFLPPCKFCVTRNIAPDRSLLSKLKRL